MRRLAVFWEFGTVGVKTGNGDGEGAGKGVGCAGL